GVYASPVLGGAADSLQRSGRPRTTERGARTTIVVPCLPLQRSRRPRTTESLPRSGIVASQLSASRKPSSEEDGEARAPVSRVRRLRRFNEAVVRGRRREPTEDPLDNAVDKRFNQSAARERRRANGGSRVEPEHEAASTKPSSEDDGEVHFQANTARRLSVLQRSRRPRTTESPIVRVRLGRAEDASTKPSSEDDGESCVSWSPSTRTAGLQRSRRPRTTESSRTRTCPPPSCRSFNEAVVR